MELSSPRSGSGRETYTALGAQSNISYWSDVQDATHCAVRPEWQAPLAQSIYNGGVGAGQTTNFGFQGTGTVRA